jgi:hypothetical protein
LTWCYSFSVKKHLYLTASLLALSSSAWATPLTRYFPDFPLAVFEAKDLQESVKATGSFGEDTQKFLGVLLNDALKSELGEEIPGALRDITVRTMIASIKDVAIGAYTVQNQPQVLVSVRLTPNNPIVNSLSKLFNDEIRNLKPAQRIREGNFLAVNDGIALGVGNNLLYLSTNADLLRSYLRRVNGQVLPVLVNNVNYVTALQNTGDGFLKQMINLTSVSQLLAREKDIPKRFLNTLRTLNVTASASSIVTDGMETRSTTQLNPNGGDAALLKLLTYTPSSLELLKQLPITAPSAAVLATDTSGWLDYIGAWLPDLEFSASEQKDLLTAFARLKDRLGNEWAVVGGSNSINPETLLTTSGLGSILSGFGSLLSPSMDSVYYNNAKDGALVLTDLETAIRTEMSKPVEEPVKPAMVSPATDTPVTAPMQNPEPVTPTYTTTLERIKLGGFDTLEYKRTDNKGVVSEAVYISNKNNTIVISANRAKLEMSLAAAPLLDNPLFKAIAFPSRINGLSFTAPIRTPRSEIDAGLNALLKAFELEKDVPSSLVTAVGDWVESYTSRTQVSHGYSLVDGNRLRSYGKEGFSWNR